MAAERTPPIGWAAGLNQDVLDVVCLRPGHKGPAGELRPVVGSHGLGVPFDLFPWFRKGTIEQISEVQWPTSDHLYWPGLDIDLSVRSIRSPDAFPLVSGTVG